jgi:hypothetical protein
VGLPAADDDAEVVGARHDPGRLHGDVADLVREDVEPEHGVHLRPIHRALGDHRRGAGGRHARRRALLGRLEEEDDRAGEVRLHSREHLGRAHEHGRVRVVPARVHDADFLAVVRRAHAASEGQVGLLDHGERVHVRTQRDDGARAPAA